MNLKTRDFLVLIGICTLLTFLWRFLEVLLDGYIIESNAHSVIVILFTWSLYKNLENNS